MSYDLGHNKSAFYSYEGIVFTCFMIKIIFLVSAKECLVIEFHLESRWQALSLTDGRKSINRI
jgi:hypothetical protein